PVGNNGGSHLGEGGLLTNPVAETYGSVYFPRENGGGGYGAGRGGGAVRITADRVQMDGVIRANGESACRGAAGGSVWIQTDSLAGTGTIETKGGNDDCGSSGSGGGGAIAVDYGTLEPGATLLAKLSAQGGTSPATGGAGTVYVKSGADAYGDLTVDNGTVGGNRRTILPALGSGTAGSGSGGATLVTGRSKPIPAYFVGHWIEVRDGATGAVEGTWRVTSVGVDGLTVTLAANAGEPLTVDEGDAWQGVYLFDRYTVRGTLQVLSSDPIRVSAEQVIAGTVETAAVRAGRLVIEPGAVLTQHLTPSSTAPESLTIEVDELVVRAGGSIDVSVRGYAKEVTYPGHQVPVGNNGGSHLGEGGIATNPPAETYGSVYFPLENGGGGFGAGRGGGAVRITADRVQLDGAVRANGQNDCRGGAGGSVWIQTGALAGTGAIEAKGGSANCGSSGAGGGGAIAVDYGTLEPGATLLANLNAQGDTGPATSGAGTVYVKSGADAHGELTVDNGTVGGNRRTVLPSLGKGTAQPGSFGAALATGRSKAIPAYFVGHWVEVRSGAAGTVEGIWRVASIAADGLTVTLATPTGEPVTVDPGDAWQGIYRFDRYTVRGTLQVLSSDPIHVYSQQVITGTVQTDSIHAESLVIEPGAVLTQHLTPSSAAPASLTIEVGELIVKAGGLIDVSARGYAKEVTYPGHLAPAGNNGGSHLGESGIATNPPAETFGSIYFPRENGGGGFGDGRGGGAVKITAGLVRVDGVIRANGQTECRGGAGGSIWIQAQTLSGAGSIETIGGNATCGSSGAGGGGAIAIEYAAVDPVSTLLDHLSAQGGTGPATAGAGTIFLRGPGANLGSLTVDNKAVTGSRRTVLPPLGRGVVQAGSSGGTVLTGRDANVPAYFVGSWVEVEGPDRVVKGIWRIASVSGTSIVLEPKAGQPFNIAAGDRWRGVYRFDKVTVSSTSVLVSNDKLVQLVPPLPEESGAGLRSITAASYEALYGNDQAPAWERSAVSIAVGSVPGSYRITLAAGAVSDPDGISEVQLTSGGRSLTAAWTATGVSFHWSGRPGQRLQLVATDAHERFRRSAWLELPNLPGGGWAPQLDLANGVTPLAVTGGADWLALAADGVWLYGAGTQPVSVVPPRAAGDEVVALAAAGDVVYAAVRERIDLLDRATETVQEMPVLGGAVVDVAADADGATLLLADPEQPVLRFARLQAGELALYSTELASLSSPSLQRTPGYLHLFGLERSGAGVIQTWTGPPSGAPEVWEVPEGWRGVGAWEQGALLLDTAGVRLVEHGADGWTEVSRVDLPAEPWSAAVAGDSLVVVLPGEIRVYDVSNAAAPVLAATHPGSSHRSVEPLTDGEVLLWSPRMAAPPLRWAPAAALPGDGFTTVIDGLP
ncbi:MAG TPA: hypothetical protein VNQ53_11435, partial [Nocardioides sp.]|nr:hypothetical protein [Nocardioides sp.]